MSVTKSELIEDLSIRAKLPKDTAEQVVNTVFESMVAALVQGRRIEVRGFGSFEVRSYKGYKGRNPRTGEAVEVAPKKLPFFKVGKDLRERVNRGAGGEAEAAAALAAPVASESPPTPSPLSGAGGTGPTSPSSTPGSAPPPAMGSGLGSNPVGSHGLDRPDSGHQGFSSSPSPADGSAFSGNTGPGNTGPGNTGPGSAGPGSAGPDSTGSGTSGPGNSNGPTGNDGPPSF